MKYEASIVKCNSKFDFDYQVLKLPKQMSISCLICDFKTSWGVFFDDHISNAHAQICIKDVQSSGQDVQQTSPDDKDPLDYGRTEQEKEGEVDEYVSSNVFQMDSKNEELCSNVFLGVTKDNELNSNAFHRDIRPNKCQDCSKAYVKKESLINHINSVHRNITYKCKLCSKSLSCKSSLKAHNDLVHLRLRPFSCKDCGKRFGQKMYLQKHTDTIHKKLTPHKCPECQRSYGQLSTLQAHIKAFHLKLRPHQCQICPKTFATKQELLRHGMRPIH